MSISFAQTLSQQSSVLRLDKNEQPGDAAPWLKHRVLNNLMHREWNRYPEAAHQVLEAKVAQYAGVHSDQVALGAGSAGLIGQLLNYYALQRKQLVIVQPTYAMFEHHCRTYGIPFTPWHLNADLQFDMETLPEMGAEHVLFLTSPNNPVGNALVEGQLEALLQRFPDTQIVLDNVYFEFDGCDHTPLLQQYPNLLILRSFSKAFPMAGVRLGYALGNPAAIQTVKRLSLTYSLNHFVLAAAHELLSDEGFLHHAQQTLACLNTEREKLSSMLRELTADAGVEVFPSKGNFLLIRAANETQHARLLNGFEAEGIRVTDASGFPMLQCCIRLSLGSASENRRMMNTVLGTLGLAPLPTEDSSTESIHAAQHFFALN